MSTATTTPTTTATAKAEATVGMPRRRAVAATPPVTPTLRVHRVGAGDPLVLLHGLG